MRHPRLTMAACLLGGFGFSVSSSPADAAAARDLMGRIPSVDELVEALTPAPRVRTRGISRRTSRRSRRAGPRSTSRSGSSSTRPT